MPLEATYRTGDGRLNFKVTGANEKEVFAQLGHLQEVFEAERSCGCCNAPHRFVVRVVGKFTYYELHCTNSQCRARFAFGQSKDTTSLFPKRKDEHGEWIPNRGWTKYNANHSDDMNQGDSYEGQ